nr:hypothetical protein Iba_chr12aCG21370 [Ipomoea batatas]
MDFGSGALEVKAIDGAGQIWSFGGRWPWISDMELWRSKRWMTPVRSKALEVVGLEVGGRRWISNGDDVFHAYVEEGWRRENSLLKLNGRSTAVEEGWRRLSAVMIMRSIKAIRKPESMCLKSYAMFLWSLP